MKFFEYRLNHDTVELAGGYGAVIEYLPLEELLARAGIVSLHCLLA